MSENRVVLTVNNEEFDAWTTVEIRDGFHESPTFSIAFTNKWAPKTAAGIQEGDACKLSIDGELVITGYVDISDEAYDLDSHSLSVEGRAKTGDLIDCSAQYGGGAIKNTTAEEVIRLVSKDFGIEVEVDPILYTDPLFTKPIDKVKLEQGAKPWEVISEVLRRKTVTALTTAEGNLLITRSSRDAIPGVVFQRRVNIKAARRRGDHTRLHSEYIFKSQKTGDDSTNGKDSSHLRGSVKEGLVTRHRPLIVLAEYPGAREDLEKRAIWERNTRRAQSERIEANVKGWRYPADNISLAFDPTAATAIVGASRSRASKGNIISINSLVRYNDDFFGYDDELLIEQRVLRKTIAEGTTCQISFVGREAYDMLEPPGPRKKRKRRNSR